MADLTILSMERYQVPEPFSDLSPEEYFRLLQLLDDYFEHFRKGCVVAIKDLLTGQMSRNEERMAEITNLAGLPSVKDTNQLVAATNMICIGSRTPEEIEDKIRQAFNKGTKGGQSTGSKSADLQIYRVIRFCILVASIIWEKKTSQASSA